MEFFCPQYGIGHWRAKTPKRTARAAKTKNNEEESNTLARDKIKPILFSIIKHSTKEELKEQLPRDIVSGIVVAIVALAALDCAGDRIGRRS